MEEHVQVMELETNNTENVPSKNNKRKRGKILKRICQQMEFYFGDSNLAKDKFLAEKLKEDPDGYVSVDMFLTFNKIRALTGDTQDIIDALASSEILEVTSDGKRLHRKKPVERTNFDECTIYVERLPPHADHKWLRDVFNRFGNVTHTSIPRFRMSGKSKGFAFIEFESPECALKASRHFKTSTESGESDTGEESDDPKDKKASGKAKKSQKEHQTAKGKDGIPHRSNKKRRRNESEGSERLGTHHKSLESDDLEGKSTKLTSEVNGKSDAADVVHSASELESLDDKNEVKTPGIREQGEKSGRKRKRRDTDNESAPKKVKCESTSGDGGESSKPQAHVSDSDSESKSVSKVKEEPLKHTGEVKSEVPCEAAVMPGSADENDQGQQAANDLPVKMEHGISDSDAPLSKRQKKRRHKKRNKADDDKPHLRVLTKAEWKTYRNKYLALQRASMVHVKRMLSLENQQPNYEEDEDDDDADEDNYDQSPIKEDKPAHEGVHFQLGVIIKLKLSEPAENCQKLTKKLRSLADVSYVDVTEGSSDVYIRCPSTEAVSTIMAEARYAEIGDTEVVEGDEEATYWKKIIADREAKYGRKSKHKKRGRDKLIARAAKMLGMNTHVHFDD